MEQNVLKLHVSAIRSLTAYIKEFELRDHAGAALPHFAAGAHLRFILPHGEGTLERHYSLINASERRSTERSMCICVSRARSATLVLDM